MASNTLSSQRRPRGGVGPRQGQPSIRDVETRPLPPPLPAALAAQGQFPNFTYMGGPVIAMPQVHVSFWGALWSDAGHQTRAQRLAQFHSDLLASGFMNVLSQYGVGQGAGNAGSYVGSSTLANAATTLTDSLIRSTIQNAIDMGLMPEPGSPANQAVIIYLDENIEINDPADGLVLCEPSNDTAFGYHNFFTTTAGNQCYYAVVPALDDNCLSNSCPDDSTCSLHLAETQEQRQTQVASHEFAEMTSDPELNAWVDPQNGENGDICNGRSDTITVGPNTWTVQQIYSKYDDMNSDGATICLASAPSPEPSLLPGS